MGDVKVNLTGDPSGAVDAFEQASDSAIDFGKALTGIDKIMSMTAAGAGQALKKFLTDSTKMAMESDRQFRQLERASGEYAGAIAAQSKAMSQLYAVDDDVINQSATLLAQWGGAAAASEEAETAALNLASAYGVDLNTATQMLIRNAENGGVGLAKMGIRFEATGDRARDFQSVIEAVNNKLAGAAEADANSLTGQLSLVGIAFEDVQKTLGGSIAKFLEQSGATTALTRSLRLLNQTMGGDDEHNRMKGLMDLRMAQNDLAEKQRAASGMATSGAPQSMIDFFVAEVDKAQAKVDLLKSSVEQVATLPGLETITGETSKGSKEEAREAARAARAAAREEATIRREMAADDARDAKELHKKELEAQDEYAKESIKIEKDRLAEIKKSQEEVNRWLAQVDKEEAAAALKAEKEAAKEEEKALKDQEERVAKKAKDAKAAGDAIGAAMVNALADQLSKLAEGGEFDAALFIGDILAAAVGIAGTVIGTAFGAPAVGSALGNLAAMGVRAGAGAISKGTKKANAGKYHDGGWVGAPRYHDGTWIGMDEQRAILQTGERVLSRKEVHHMGGPAGVDNMARGGSRVTLNVTAIDAKSVADTFADAGGKGLRDAMRRGHGSLPALLGRGPR